MHAAVEVMERGAQEEKSWDERERKRLKGEQAGGQCFPPAACGMWLGGVGHRGRATSI